ncbi:MAG: hypothetical protein IPL23_23550 [Saprospiraceae bacterium]|nr:hypothetical protein [Saprospiraceae bacterium]
MIEIILDGITGNHRLFANSLGGLYTLIINLIEILSFLALIATFVFLYRRNLLKVPRLVKSELNGWPKLDANYILLGELLFGWRHIYHEWCRCNLTGTSAKSLSKIQAL